MFGAAFLDEARRAWGRSPQRRFRRLHAFVLLAEFGIFFATWSMYAMLPAWSAHFFGPPFSVGQNPVSGGAYPGLAAAETVWSFFALLTGQTLLLILLATPALAAGSIAGEKTRGTLALVLLTELSAAEIILGKWLAQVLQVVLLALPVVPLLTFLLVLGGLHPSALVMWAVESLLLALALSAAALLVSVWAQRTADAVLIVYLAGGGILAGLWWAGFDTWFGLLSFLEPSYQLAGLAWGDADALAALAGLAAACPVSLAVASWRLRPVHAGQLAGAARAGRLTLWLERAPLETTTPVRWKERYAGELGLLSWVRWLPRRVQLGGVALLSLLASLAVWGNDEAVLVHGLALILSAGLVVLVRASGSISGEREKQTWEALLLSRLKASDMIRGKFWGIIDGSRPCLLTYLVPALACALVGGIWPTFCLVYCWLASWAFLYNMAANGLFTSGQSGSSWQSLFRALSAAFLNLFVRGIVTLVITMVFLQISTAALMLVWPSGFGRFLGTGPFWYSLVLVACVTPVLYLLVADAEILLGRAEDEIIDHQRGGLADIPSVHSVHERRRERRERRAARTISKPS